MLIYFTVGYITNIRCKLPENILISFISLEGHIVFISTGLCEMNCLEITSLTQIQTVIVT